MQSILKSGGVDKEGMIGISNAGGHQESFLVETFLVLYTATKDEETPNVPGTVLGALSAFTY